MENWFDQGIVLSARPHGENGAVVALITEEHGRHAGYVHGGQSSKNRGMLQPGSLVQCEWSARTSENLGNYKLEPSKGLPADILSDPLKLGALLSACSLCDVALPEREGHPGLFYGLQALIQMMEADHWGAGYIMWEIAFLKELGFGLELTKCAGGGDAQALSYVSPKTGRAVSEGQGEPYKDKLLPMPDFLRPNGSDDSGGEIYKGLQMTGYFLEHWVFTHHTKGVPEPRLRFEARYAKTVADLNDSQTDETSLSYGAG